MSGNRRPGASATDRRLLHLSPADNVCAVATRLAAGSEVRFQGAMLSIADDLPVGHKVAVRSILAGEKVLKYGASIGTATRDIRPGEHVHLHNLASDYLPPEGRAAASSAFDAAERRTT